MATVDLNQGTATSPDRTELPPPSRATDLARRVAVLALTLVMLDAVAGVLPADPVVWLLTPARLVLLAGIAAVLGSGRRLRAWTTWLDLPVAVLLGASALSALASGQGWSVWRAQVTCALGFCLTVGVMRRHASAWSAVTTAALVGVGASSLVALHQVAYAVPTGFCRAGLLAARERCDDPGAMVRATGTFTNPNLLAAALALLLPVAWAGARSLSTSSSRLVAHLVVVAGYAALLLTWSRAGIVGAAAGVALLLVSRHGGGRRGPAALGLALVAGLVVVLGSGVGVRRDIWGAALRAAAVHPLGVGPGRAGAVIDRRLPGGEMVRHAHDLWLNWLLEGGWLAGLALVVLTAGAAWLVRRGIAEGSIVARAGGAGLLGFAVLSVVDHPANSVAVSTLVWVVLALVASHRGPHAVPGRAPSRAGAVVGRGRRGSHRAEESAPR